MQNETENNEWNNVTLALQHAQRILLYSARPGVGKTHTALTDADGRDVYAVSLHADMCVPDLLGQHVLVADPVSHHAIVVWQDGPLLLAFRHRGRRRLVLDEIDKAPQLQSILLLALDNPTVSHLTLPSGEHVHIHDPAHLQIVATCNTVPRSEILMDRFECTIGLTRPHPRAIEALGDYGKAVAATYKTDSAISVRKTLAWLKLSERMPAAIAAELVWGQDAGNVHAALMSGRE